MEFEDQNRSLTDNSMMLNKPTMNILCCMCGISFNPQQAKTNICTTCLTSSTDVTMGITKQGILNFCRMCRRYNRPPWVYMERESKDLLSLCLKKIKGLNKVKLLDAQFIWTEPHSRRIKIRLTIQAEVINKTSLQHTFEVEFFEHYMQCDDCKKEFTPHTWGAVVQVRQRVSHKRTFYFLEQMILKHNAHTHLIKVEEKDEGLDFYYKHKNHAIKLVDYLQTILPMKIKPSKQLVSYEEQNDNYVTKYSWSAEIPRICKDDLVILPPKLVKELGGCCPLLLCIKLSTTIRLLDTRTMKRIELTPDRYYHYESDLQIITLKNNKSEFMVMDCEKQHDSNLNESYQTSMSNIFIDKIYNIQISRTSDWQQFEIKTHLGGAIKVGATLEGYDLTKINYEEIDKLKNIPDVIMVRRIFDKTQKSKRIWKLNRLDKEGVMMEEGPGEKFKKKKTRAQDNANNDFEEFLDDIEGNKDMQKAVRLYKDEENIKRLTERQRARRNKKVESRKDRKTVVVTNIRKKDTNIFNKKEVEEEEEEAKDFKEPKSKKLNKKQLHKEQEKQLQKESEEEEDSDYDEKDGIKIYQLEEWFDNINLDEKEDADEKENDHIVESFIKDLDKKMGMEKK